MEKAKTVLKNKKIITMIQEILSSMKENLGEEQITLALKHLKEAKEVLSTPTKEFYARSRAEGISKKITLIILFAFALSGIVAIYIFKNQQVFEIFIWIFLINLATSEIIQKKLELYLLGKMIKGV